MDKTQNWRENKAKIKGHRSVGSDSKGRKSQMEREEKEMTKKEWNESSGVGF